ncbi:autoinducer binding domain-containing protein [Chromobacterium violaceum]|uniref:helix-turn-helix transcriptional regulator n=1 Tax=Chromobacterium violaceum TaxID=536 RepID=UPI001B31F853|nr:LuxR family transcriptional regulator [Chromobacterium violaceum]MBP4051981.1 autoinducer binding domain-containing protein [Chromobacterium violaceum]
MLLEVPSAALAHLALLQRSLLRLDDEDDFRAFLLGLRAALPGWPPILLARQELDELHRVPLVSIDLGWSREWLQMYQSNGWHEVDPILSAPVGVPIVWSDRLFDPASRPRLRTEQRRLQRFLAECSAWKMTHGLSYTSVQPDCRVIVSLVGEEVERDGYTRQLLSLLLPSIAESAGRALAQNARMGRFSPRQREIFVRLTRDGMTQEEVADALGVSMSTIKNQLRMMREAYGAKTLAQLVHRAGGSGWREMADDIGKIT